MTSSSNDAPYQWDVLVVGGGIHGVGVAQAAAASGLDVILLERSQLAAATSSKSSKLIHGGLRYLETMDFGLVYESLQERERLLKIAPQIVHRQAFLIPVYPGTSRSSWKLRLGLGLYWTLAGWRHQTGFRKVPRQQWPELDGLIQRDLKCVWQYWDAQTDDAALTRAVMRSAQSLGAQLWCPAEMLSAHVNASGCEVCCSKDGKQHRFKTRTIVNAGGPWVSEIAGRINPSPPVPAVDLVQGTHIELSGRMLMGCYYLEAPRDRRAVFVMPWRDHTMVGTTERVHQGAPATAAPTTEEIDYLLEVYRHYFPQRDTQLLDQWAGLRVLPATDESANRRSRETQLPVDDASQPRVVSIVGGKLTGYRATADKVMRLLKPSLPQRPVKADTARLPLTPMD